MEGLKSYACYQRGFSGHFSGFKLAISTYVLPTLDVYQLNHIPQALDFHYYLLTIC